MAGVLQGFSIIALIIAVGVLLDRTGRLGPSGRHVLNALAFRVATPALLFGLMHTAELDVLFSAQFAVTAVGMVLMALVYAAIGAVARWGAGPTTIGALCASFVNSGNLGIPIAVYVLGDGTLVAPVMLVQQLIMSPVMLAVLDVASRGPDAPRLRWWQLLVRPFANPIVIGALSGLALNVAGIRLPGFALEPILLIGGISVPAVLIAFGMSMRDSAVPLRGPERGQVLLASALKALVHPLVAWAIGLLAFGLDARTLLVVVVTAALPAAQNIYNYAAVAGVGERLARESILLTTIASVPVIVLATLLLHP
ncbi:MAG: AEC family transporter [Microbacteriaceae bacterium]|nr:AEC family transporter [Microbacteriaceae bacterium]